MTDAEVTKEIKRILLEAVNYGSESQKYKCDCYSAFEPELVQRMRELIDGSTNDKTCRRLQASNDYFCLVIHRRSNTSKEFGYWKCSRCGAECFDGARYCMNCGAKVVGDDA